MSTSTDTEMKPPVEALSEVERARATFVKKLSRELQEFLKGDQDSDALASFISNTVAERLGKNSKLPPEGLAELFEGMPSLDDMITRMDEEGTSATIHINNTVALDARIQQLAFEEMTRAQLLARAADIDFRGKSLKSKAGGLDTPHLTDWLKTYSSLHSGTENKTDFRENHPNISIRSPKKSDTELMADAYTDDPELFADMMVAFGIREGATRKGSSFNEAWRRMSGKGYDNYGATISLSEEGVPYRSGKRQEDTKLVLERAKLLGSEAKVRTYQDLEGEVGQLQRTNEVLIKENGSLKGSQTELQGQIATLQSESGTVAQREKMAKMEVAEEKQARKLAEAKAATLEQRIQELLAIAEEKVGTFSKDTRAGRMRQLAESPLPKK